MTRKLNIDVFFDFICPWCLIGKRQLQAAIQQLALNHPDVEVILNWHGVQLLPHLPQEGVPFHAFYQQRLGSIEAVRMRQAQVFQAASAAGVQIHFESIQLMPNTAKAHQLFKHALATASAEQCNVLLERLFAAYFNRAEDLGNSKVLSEIVADCGLSSDDLTTVALQSSDQGFRSADTGANGVPYFIFDRRRSLAGAQPAEVIYQAMLSTLEAQGA